MRRGPAPPTSARRSGLAAAFRRRPAHGVIAMFVSVLVQLHDGREFVDTGMHDCALLACVCLRVGTR